MPRLPLYALVWSDEQAHYELFTREHLDQRFARRDEPQWLAWLDTHPSFAFHGAAGSLNVYREKRARGGTYWYAYFTAEQRTRKRYLGQTGKLTFARLEEVASELRGEAFKPARAPKLAQKLHNAADQQGKPDKSEQMVASMQLAFSRLTPPLLPSSLVVRERLLERLDTGLSHRLTLISAPAGAGKTTLLSLWATRVTFPLAWLSLDVLDNEPQHFWVSVLSALRSCHPGFGEVVLAMLRSPQPPPLGSILEGLLQALSKLAGPIVLLLDDYHVIEEQSIHASLLSLLEHLPGHVHLMLSSRVDPPLALSRWRVRGQLLELRGADLRFRQEEAANFLTQAMALSLPQEEMAQLARRTEGWIAGLQLAALALRQHGDHSAFVKGFTGGHRHVLDYVQEEILAGLPANLQELLLQSAILNRLSASLCQAVTGESESQALLEQAERANLFLVPLDEERRWYRMHELFREALQARLRATRPELWSQLHRRAARWYEEHGELRAAISHALQAADFFWAASLMERVAEQLWLSGESQTLYKWVMLLPATVLHRHARFVLTAALYVLVAAASLEEAQFVSARAQMEEMIERVERVLHLEEGQAAPASLAASELVLLQQRLQLLRLGSQVIRENGQYDREQYRLIDKRMQHLDQAEDEAIWQMIPLSVKYILQQTLEAGGASLVPLFLEAKQRFRLSSNRFVPTKVMQWLTGSYLRAGKLHLAYQECEDALNLIAQTHGPALLSGYLACLADYFTCWQANILYYWNRLEEARNILRGLLRNAQSWRRFDLQISGYVLLIEVELAARNFSAAQQLLQQLEELLRDREISLYRSIFSQVQVKYWLAVGELDKATSWAACTAFSPEDWNPERTGEILALVRVQLAQQEFQAALASLEQFSTQLDRPEDMATTMAFLALDVVALQQVGKREQACDKLRRLLTLAEPEGYIRIFLESGAAMRDALQHGGEHSSAAFVSLLLAAFDKEAQATAQTTSAQALAQIDIMGRARLIEPLTIQEQRILRLLMAGCSNQDVASTLVISLNTVKTHLKHLYSKLNVHNRTQASALARQLRLL
ncbi:LuxR family transcriptional regulator [Ktedonosporobacter rubrisoli]|uniref:LuxR family transcriptional regulator n=1 Tax=Ktedonosporobacter rubrisoli TaxID=2509675 RepID=A0A4P6JKZ9_KTERU|nr:LuxR C-terminal-related transcriptional regulator [Ktedonosporobacter rubrisoli]QBD75887.1 LuxR family transcriptional regulator [Ktedonosporobacter rubrisoli]